MSVPIGKQFSNIMNSDAMKSFGAGMTMFNAAVPNYKKSNGMSLLSLNQNVRKGTGNHIFDGAGRAVDITTQGLDMIDKFIQNNNPRNKRSLLDKANVFGFGGKFGNFISQNSDEISQGLETGTALIGNALNQAQINDTTELENGIKNSSVGGTTTGMSFDDLSNQWASTSKLNHISWKDIRPNSTFSDILNGISAGNQGAQTGMGISGNPVGAVVGGILGTGSSIIGSIIGRRRAKKQAKKINSQIDNQNNLNERTLINNLGNISDTQSDNLLANFAAYGGNLQTQGGDWTNGLIWINNGGTHEQNPQEGVPMGIAPDGLPNLVEEGEVIHNDYVYSKRVKVPENMKQKYKLKKDSTFADAVAQVSKESKERPNDPISKNGLEAALQELRDSQEAIKEKKEIQKQKKEAIEQAAMEELAQQLGGTQASMGNQMPVPEMAANTFCKGGHLYNDGTELWKFPDTNTLSLAKKETQKYIDNLQETADTISAMNRHLGIPAKSTSNKEEFKPLDTRLRYAPVFGNMLGLGLSFLPTDYGNAERLEKAANQVGDYDRVAFNPIGNYLTYKPFDINYTANQLRASERANARNIMNLAGGNRGAAMAGLLSNNLNSQVALANAYRQAAEENRKQEQVVEDFNRGTNTTNSQGLLEAARANQAARAQAQSHYLGALGEAAKMRQAIDDAKMASRSANLSNLFTSLGNIGNENFAFNQAATNEALLYLLKKNGTQAYKGNSETPTKAYGGMLTKKRKGGKR